MEMIWVGQNFKFPCTRGLRVPKMAYPRPKNVFLGPKKIFKIFFRNFIPKYDVWYQNQPSIICRSQVMAIQKLAVPKNRKILKAHNTPPRGPRAKKFWISKFLPRGYLMTKNGQNRWDEGVQSLSSDLEWAISSTINNILVDHKQ